MSDTTHADSATLGSQLGTSVLEAKEDFKFDSISQLIMKAERAVSNESIRISLLSCS